MIDLRDATVSAREVIAALGLLPHPEGGHYREIWRDSPADGTRGAGTAIYFLLAAGEVSHWHCVDASEAWHWYAGAPLALSLSMDGRGIAVSHLGPDLTANQQPFLMVPKGCWQSAVSLGGWTLVGCTVAPAFDFAGFALAPPGWRPEG